MNAPHSLFPVRRAARSTPEVGFIQVRRRESDGWKRAAKTFPAGELRDARALKECFGGGTYELIARSANNRRITARARLEVPGDPKPLGEAPASSTVRHAKPEGRAHPSNGALGRFLALFERGKLQARVFRMFERDAEVAEIVRATKLPADEVRRLWVEYTTPLGYAPARDLEHPVDETERRANEHVRELHERERLSRADEREKRKLDLAERLIRLREEEIKLAAKGRAVESRVVPRDAEYDVLAKLLSVLSDGATTQGPDE
jgi:hypothetical protein